MNNRQNNRRRSRPNLAGGPNNRPQGGQRGGDQANRIDSRARGNAAQLLEKYKNMARDAQQSGDRVQTEYYLQHADHYFRVLSDSRQRQEEQRQRFEEQRQARGEGRGEGRPDGRDDRPDRAERRHDDQRDRYAMGVSNFGEDDGADQADHESDGAAMPYAPRRERPAPASGGGRDERGDDRDGDAHADGAEDYDNAPARRSRSARPARNPRGEEAGAAARGETGGDADADGQGVIDQAVLPPSLGRSAGARTRTRRVADQDGEGAPGASPPSDASDEAAPTPAPRVRRARRATPVDAAVDGEASAA